MTGVKFSHPRAKQALRLVNFFYARKASDGGVGDTGLDWFGQKEALRPVSRLLVLPTRGSVVGVIDGRERELIPGLLSMLVL